MERVGRADGYGERAVEVDREGRSSVDICVNSFSTSDGGGRRDKVDGSNGGHASGSCGDLYGSYLVTLYGS